MVGTSTEAVQHKHAWGVLEPPGMQHLECTSCALQCTGPSMFPTLNSRGDTPLLPFSLPFLNIKGDLILLEHFSVFAKIIKVGDVVTAYSVQNPRHIVCKRVLGLEGDTIKVPWSSTNGPARTVKVPAGHVWLQGDNTLNSTDSRHYGPVPYALVNGKAFLKIWPLKEAGWVSSHVPALL